MTTLKEQTRKYLEENITGLGAEEAAVAAFLSLRLGELEKTRQALAAYPARDIGPSAANQTVSTELLHN